MLRERCIGDCFSRNTPIVTRSATFFVAFALLFLVSLSVATAFAGGDGTAGNPYQIATAEQLANISSNMSAYYNLTSGFTTSLTYDPWVPIGSLANPFTGTLYGNGNPIILSANQTGADNIGLFEAIENATIISLVFVGSEVIGENYVGMLAGHAKNSVLTSIGAGGTVVGQNYTGGLIGNSTNNTITLMQSSVDVEGYQYVGGLIGYSRDSIINDSYSAAYLVDGHTNVGGLIGRSTDEDIIDSYFDGAVIGAANTLGGLLGYALGTTSITDSYALINLTCAGTCDYTGGLVGIGLDISSSYAIGSLSGVRLSSGGLAGSISSSATILNSNATVNVTSTGGYVGGLVGEGSFGSDIINSSAFGIVNSTGNAIGGLAGSAGGYVNNSYATGAVYGGSQSVGGLIGSAISSASVYDSYATGNVDGTTSVGGLIGNSDSSSGTINNSYATGTVTATGDNVGGLVGRLDADVYDSYATGNVSGGGYVGGFVGLAFFGSSVINNSYATGTVDASGNFIGGFAGQVRSQTIYNSYSTGNVASSGSNVGGFVGSVVLSSEIFRSYSSSFVNGTSFVGGFVGTGNSGQINDSYATGNVVGNSSVGGFVGIVNNFFDIFSSYSVGTIINGSGVNIGAFTGEFTPGTVNDSYWNNQTAGIATSAANATGRSTADMKTQGTFTNWNFTDIWAINSLFNDGYPYLQWQTFDVTILSPGNISECGTINQNGTYTVNASIIADGSLPCIDVVADNVLIDLNSYTINATYAIRAQNVDNVTVQDGNIVYPSVPSGSYSWKYALAMFMSNVSNVTVTLLDINHSHVNITGAEDVDISFVSVVKNYGGGIYLTDVNRSSVTDTTVTVHAAFSTMRFSNTNDLVFTGGVHVLNASSGDAINIDSGDNISMDDIYVSSGSSALVMNGPSNVTVNNSVFIGGLAYALSYSGSMATFVRSNFTGNTSDKLVNFQLADTVTFAHNRAINYNSSGYAVYGKYFDNSLLYNNYLNVTGKSSAIVFESASSTGNNWSVTPYAGVNILGLDAEIGGNYFSYPACSFDTDMDYFCDDNVTIANSNSTDLYPLTRTFQCNNAYGSDSASPYVFTQGDSCSTVLSVASGASGKVIDCDNNLFTGDGTAAGIIISSGVENFTLRNCRFSGFAANINFSIDNMSPAAVNVTLDNLHLTDSPLCLNMKANNSLVTNILFTLCDDTVVLFGDTTNTTIQNSNFSDYNVSVNISSGTGHIVQDNLFLRPYQTLQNWLSALGDHTFVRNQYYDIANFSIYDSDADGYGDFGSDYPYNSTNGALVSGVSDAAPRLLDTDPSPVIDAVTIVSSSGNNTPNDNVTATVENLRLVDADHVLALYFESGSTSSVTLDDSLYNYSVAVSGATYGASSGEGSTGGYSFTSNDYMLVDSTALTPQTENFTAYAWMQCDQAGVALSTQETNTSQGWSLYCADNGVIAAALQDANGNRVVETANFTQAQYVAFVWDSLANDIIFYVNGSQATTTVVENDTINASIAAGTNLSIGRYVAGSNYYEGVLDDVLLFTRDLTQVQINRFMRDVAVQSIYSWEGSGALETKVLLPFEGTTDETATSNYANVSLTINVVDMPTWQAFGGYDGGAYYSLVSNDSILINDDDQIDLATSDGGSIALWIRPTESESVFQIEKGNGNSCLASQYAVYLYQYYRLEGCSGGGQVRQDAALTEDEWNYVVYTWDDTAKRLYVNGALVNSDTGVTTSNTVNPLTIQGEDVDIDHIAVFEHALAAEQIAQFYTADYSLIHSEQLSDNDDLYLFVTPTTVGLDGTSLQSSTLSFTRTAFNILGNASSVNTSGVNLSITVAGSSDLSGDYSGLVNLTFLDLDRPNNRTVMIVQKNFSQDFDLSDVLLAEQTGGVVANLTINRSIGEAKWLFVEPQNYTQFCVRDAVTTRFADVSFACTGANETEFSLSECQASTTRSGVTCDVVSGLLRFSGLNNSGILGLTPTLSAVTLSSTYGYNTTLENFTASPVGLVDHNGAAVQAITVFEKVAGGTATSFAVADFRFDGGTNDTYAKDYSTFDTPITFGNDVSYENSSGYNGTGALSFDGGAAAYVGLGSGSHLDDLIHDMSGGGASLRTLAMSAWIKPDANHTGTIASKGYYQSGFGQNNSLGWAWKVVLSPGTNYLQFENSHTNNSAFDAGRAIWRTNVSSISADTWQHVAISYVGGISESHFIAPTIYIDGVQQTVTKVQNGSGTRTSLDNYTVYLGARQFNASGGGYDERYKGLIDSFMIFNSSYGVPSSMVTLLANNRDDIFRVGDYGGLSAGDSIRACVTPNNGLRDGDEICSANTTLVRGFSFNDDITALGGSGISSPQVRLNGAASFDPINPVGVYSLSLYDGADIFANVTRNFSSSVVFANYNATVTSSFAFLDGITAARDENESMTLYLDDNDFESVCVKEDVNTSITRVCTNENETSFTPAECMADTQKGNYTCHFDGSTYSVDGYEVSAVLAGVTSLIDSFSASADASSAAITVDVDDEVANYSYTFDGTTSTGNISGSRTFAETALSASTTYAASIEVCTATGVCHTASLSVTTDASADDDDNDNGGSVGIGSGGGGSGGSGSGPTVIITNPNDVEEETDLDLDTQLTQENTDDLRSSAGIRVDGSSSSDAAKSGSASSSGSSSHSLDQDTSSQQVQTAAGSSDISTRASDRRSRLAALSPQTITQVLSDSVSVQALLFYILILVVVGATTFAVVGHRRRTYVERTLASSRKEIKDVEKLLKEYKKKYDLK